jgi:hypothetical protein
MDPYLEGTLWPDVHGSLIYRIRAALVAALPAGYFAIVDQYVWLGEGEPEQKSRRGQPDVFVINGSSPHPARTARVTAAIAEPTIQVQLPLPENVQRKRYIRLIDAEDRGIVTVIELLSPFDKLPKKDRTHYLAKRDEYLASGINLIEIDLLRKRHRVPMGEPDPPEADYYFLVSKAADYPAADVWAFTVRDEIPVFPVPLKSEHSAIPLNLRKCLDEAYDEAGYVNRIDYSKSPSPALRRPDAEWANEFLKKSARKLKK